MAERGRPEQPGGFEQLAHESTPLRTIQSQASPVAGGITEKEERNGDVQGKQTANRGFAAMDREKQKRIASEGGRAAHKQGVAHEWSHDEARLAGQKGGQIVSKNREHMSEIGRKGGQNSGQRRQRNEE